MLYPIHKLLSLISSSSEHNQRSVLLPRKSFLHSCLHRNWIRAFSFSNMCLSVVYFALLMLKHFHSNLVQPSSPTLYSLPLNLLQQLNINFNTFHLFILSISVFQYFLRYYRLLKTTYSSYFFNGQNLLLTKHTNVALILSGSLALIFAYNFVFYNSTESHTISFLPLITLNMILLPLINLLVFIFILICFLLNLCFKSNHEQVSAMDEQENLRLMIEKKTCIKCYSKILQTNPNLFHDQNYSYRNLYKNFFSTNLRSSYSFQLNRDYFFSKKKTRSQIDLSNEQDNPLFDRQTSMKLNNQHSSCHLSYYFLLIFLFKYILFTFPQNTIQMYVYFMQFYYFILKKQPPNQYIPPFDDNNNSFFLISRFLFLFSRVGDSLLLIRLSYLIKKYFPCWCHFNSKFFREQQQSSHRILTAKYSESSTNEPTSPLDITNSNDIEQQVSIKNAHHRSKHRRFRLQFQFMPLWSRHRPRLFQDSN